MHRRILIAAAAAISSLVAATPAGAITGGEPDGNGHPNVGLHYFTQLDGTFRCSDALIAPRLVLTAAHCTENVIGPALVTFDNPAPLRPAAGGDPARFVHRDRVRQPEVDRQASEHQAQRRRRHRARPPGDHDLARHPTCGACAASPSWTAWERRAG